MTPTPSLLILWTGPKHSGKTTSVTRLAQIARTKGYIVAGCVAPSIYVKGVLLGFDIVDLRNDRRIPLARRPPHSGAIGGFEFTREGRQSGNRSLSPTATRDAHLIIVDEFGPLELAFEGWRMATDRLMTSISAVLLLVVREELVGTVRQLYAGIPTRILAPAHEDSIDSVLAVLGNNRVSSSYGL